MTKSYKGGVFCTHKNDGNSAGPTRGLMPVLGWSLGDGFLSLYPIGEKILQMDISDEQWSETNSIQVMQFMEKCKWDKKDFMLK